MMFPNTDGRVFAMGLTMACFSVGRFNKTANFILYDKYVLTKAIGTFKKGYAMLK